MANVALELPVPYIGKNVERKHVEEFFRYHREPDEVVIALFDGIVFDGDGKRVGGLTLHDYVILTDQHFILWARGLQSDVLDRLDYRGVCLSAKPADTLHGELALEFTPPAVPKALTARVDLLPIMDLPALEELFGLTKSVATWQGGQSDKPKTTQPPGTSTATTTLPPDEIVANLERIRAIVQEAHAKRGTPFKAPAPTARPVPPQESAAKEPSLDSPFGTGRPVSNTSYAVYRVAQAAKDAIGTFPTDLGKTVGLDETLSKLVDRIPKVEDIGQITALIEALNKLLVTVSENPAARAFLLQAIDRMVEQGSPLKQLLSFIQNAGKPTPKPTAPTSPPTEPATAAVAAPSPSVAAGARRTAVKVSFAKDSHSPAMEVGTPSPPLAIAYGSKGTEASTAKMETPELSSAAPS